MSENSPRPEATRRDLAHRKALCSRLPDHVTMRLQAAALLTVGLVFATAHAQTGTPRDSVYRAMLNFGSLVERASIEPNWMADKRSFWYVERHGDTTAAFRVDPSTGAATPLLDAGRTRDAMRKSLGYEPPYHGLPFSTFTLSPDEKSATFDLGDRRWRLDLSTYTATAMEIGRA